MGIFSAPRWDDGGAENVGSKVLDTTASAQKKSGRRKKKQLLKKAGSPVKVSSADDTGNQSDTTEAPKKAKKFPFVFRRDSAPPPPKIKLNGSQEVPITPPSDASLSKRQKRRQNLKMKKLLKFQSTASSVTTPSNGQNVSPKKGKAIEEKTDRVLGKIEKVLEIRKKRRRAKKAKKESDGSVTVSLANEPSPLKSPEIVAETNLKAKLKRKERKLKRKEALAKKKELEQANNSNEIVLSRKKKKKMRKIAKQASGNNLNQAVKNDQDALGTANPSFDTSLSDSSTPLKNNDTQLEKKKKRRKRKKKTGLEDSVDGNIPSASAKFSLHSNSQNSKNKPSLTLTDSDSIADKSRRKKVVIAKLLQESNIDETKTLHDLKKKRLQDRLDAGDDAVSPKRSKKNASTSLREKMTQQLKSSRFRWLNEQLYTTNSWEAMKYFKEDPDAFDAYHSGYRNQVAQWPVNPLDVIIQSISSLPKETVVADFGCGDARLAATLPHLKVHSLDLISSKPEVVACDMAHTPLLMESVDVAVFCLSLMGTNLNDFVLEANRVLKNGGLLMIAEVESRFEDVDNFTSAMVHFGFQLKKKDLSNQMFIFMDFKKTRKASKTGKLPALALEPCVYKKR
ncbi:ribosomal RNA-processing protein 8 [Frankliniella occidentalis]|uniref:Ribosomal RNA-processing protein 8 n=1 Tax=Frankliniella occidentalis TaxID=133901 RepID=A0A6J1STK9_FRAOC|nr:ribosomal RNA-processing protein 8 [Frankliniella occidentalis]